MKINWKNYLVSFLAIIGITLLLAPFSEEINATAIALALLLVILFIAAAFGSRPAFLASIVGVLCFNFFFLPPIHTFTIADPQNWIAFGAFLVTSLTAGQLSSYARRRAAESETRRQEIERLYRELQAAFAQASQAEAFRQSEQLKSALLDAVTHDLRTPLTSIKASVTTLLEGEKEAGGTDENAIVLDKESRLEFLDIINEETDRLNQFIGGMVSLARVEAGKMSLRKTWSEVEEIIGNAVERARIRLTGHRVIVETTGELPVVRVDAHSIAEVVYTLLDNAAKYSPENSEIRVAARHSEKTDEMVEISVEDQGRGIIPEMRERVFEKFSRAAENDIHSTSSGLGLGLAIARGIVESQGGRIWIEDGHDRFMTRVVFQIPIGDDENNNEKDSEFVDISSRIPFAMSKGS